MEVDEHVNGSEIPGEDQPGRWSHVRKLLERRGPFSHENMNASPEMFDMIRNNVKVLVIGAGGLGCELLKDLALMGFKHIHVIDMDTIDVSNLNRQFLFRQTDVGSYKAEVAARFINKRVSGAEVIAHNCKIQDFDEDFYLQFHLIVCGLDSIVARRWINGMVMSLKDTQPIPIIDGGTEGFKGNARVIIPGQTACIECTLDLFPPQINYPLCTIATTPRLPEHCVEYVKLLLWPKENPFSDHASGDSIAIDGDDPQHITWIYEKALERSNTFGIRGVTYRLTQGVVKRIIPAVASTNAVIAAACAMEVFKLASSCCANHLQNYMVFNDSCGIYTYAYEPEKKEDCLACSQTVKDIQISGDAKLQEFIDMLVQEASYQMKNPGLRSTTADGKQKTLYMSNVKSIEEATRPNLKKSLRELGLESGCEVIVADVTTPQPLTFKLIFD